MPPTPTAKADELQALQRYRGLREILTERGVRAVAHYDLYLRSNGVADALVPTRVQEMLMFRPNYALLLALERLDDDVQALAPTDWEPWYRRLRVLEQGLGVS